MTNLYIPLSGTGYGDYEYRRAGTRNLFLACEPLAAGACAP